MSVYLTALAGGLSQHLGELRGAELVMTRRQHRVVFYKLIDARALTLLQNVATISIEGYHRPMMQNQTIENGTEQKPDDKQSAPRRIGVRRLKQVPSNAAYAGNLSVEKEQHRGG
jgi:hypothetical protein